MMTRQEFKAMKAAQQGNKIKKVVKKVVIIGGILITILTYTFVDGQTIEVQAKGSEVVESSILVQQGDSLTKIAKMTGTTVAAIEKVNKLQSDRIYEGQVLKLPTNAELVVELPKETAKETTTVKATTYVVQKGDNLMLISKKTGISIENLRNYNYLVGDLIFEGETLRLTGEVKKETKAKQTVSSATSASSSTKKQATVQTKSEVKAEQVHQVENGKHVVQNGENLYRIAQKHGLTVDELKALNHLTSDAISVNTTLVVSKNDSTTVQKTKSNSIVPMPAISYTVKAGETFYQLEEKFDVDRSLILEWNAKKHANLIIGERIVIYGEAYQALATFGGAADNHSVAVIIDGEEEILRVDYNEATSYNRYIGKQKSIQWIESPNGERVLVNVK